MTSEAHKRNPPGSERWGPKSNITLIDNEYELAAMAADVVGSLRVYVHEFVDDAGKSRVQYFAEADELARWRAARLDTQAGEAHGA